MPEDLRIDLEQLCCDREPAELLFQSSRGDRGAFERKWLNRLVQRTCEAAGTRIVCAHGLRDTYTSLLASLARVSHADIARLVGHADNGVTARRHYIGQPQHNSALTLGAAQEAGGDVA